MIVKLAVGFTMALCTIFGYACCRVSGYCSREEEILLDGDIEMHEMRCED